MHNYTNLAFHLLTAEHYAKKANTGANPNDFLPGIPEQTWDPSTIGFANTPDALKQAQPELASKLLWDKIKGVTVGGSKGVATGAVTTPLVVAAALSGLGKGKFIKNILPSLKSTGKYTTPLGGLLGGFIGADSGSKSRQRATVTSHNQHALEQLPNYYKQFLSGPTIEKLPPYIQSLIGKVPENPLTAMSVAELLQKSIPEGRDADVMKKRTRDVLKRLNPQSFE